MIYILYYETTNNVFCQLYIISEALLQKCRYSLHLTSDHKMMIFSVCFHLLQQWSYCHFFIMYWPMTNTITKETKAWEFKRYLEKISDYMHSCIHWLDAYYLFCLFFQIQSNVKVLTSERDKINILYEDVSFLSFNYCFSFDAVNPCRWVMVMIMFIFTNYYL